MANPFPFTAGQVLTAAQMNGIGETTTFTPTWTNLTVGNGTQDFRYGRVQNFINVVGLLTFGSTTSISGSVSMSLPVATNVMPASNIVGGVRINDAGTAVYVGYGRLLSTNLGIVIAALVSSGTYVTEGLLSASAPFTWTTNDQIWVNFVYEVD